MSKFAFLSLFIVFTGKLFACECPQSSLSLEECAKYEIIFRGKVAMVRDCGSKPGEAIFEVEELYKGNSPKEFKVLFDCGGTCAKKFSRGEEWIIYSRYKQIDNAFMDWCSRSRKFFRNDKEDYYLVLYGNDYEDELSFLRKNLGIHRLLEKKQVVENRNKKPDTLETALILIISLGGLILFYYLFNKFFR